MNKKLLPLLLLDDSGSGTVEGITRFQKLVFLSQKEALRNELYSFKPGSYGPYSKELYNDIDLLVDQGFIREVEEPTARPNNNNKQVYKLAPKGKRVVEQALSSHDYTEERESIGDISEQFNQMPLWDLLEYVYGKYPNMAENSKLNI